MSMVIIVMILLLIVFINVTGFFTPDMYSRRHNLKAKLRPDYTNAVVGFLGNFLPSTESFDGTEGPNRLGVEGKKRRKTKIGTLAKDLEKRLGSSLVGWMSPSLALISPLKTPMCQSIAWRSIHKVLRAYLIQVSAVRRLYLRQ